MKKNILLKYIYAALVCSFLSTVHANVLGDFQTFVPNTDGLYFITVDSGQTLNQHTLVGNAYISYAKNYLLTYDNINTQNYIKYKDSVTSLDGTVGYSATDSLQIFMGFTQLLDYAADNAQPSQYTLSTGVHSFRPGIKWKLSSEKDSQMSVLASSDILNVEDDPYTGANPPDIYNIGLAWSARFNGAATHGFNFGYRHREPGSVTAVSTFYPLKSQLTFSYGYSYPWTSKTRLVFETIGCLPVDKGENKSSSDLNCLDLLGAVRHRLNNNWAFVTGATLEPGVQSLSPDYRVFAGMNVYAFPESSESKSEPSNDPLLPAPIMTTEPEPATNAEVVIAAAPLSIEPENGQVYIGNELAFMGHGGNPPYKYEITSGAGSINPDTGIYKAPLKPTMAYVQITDSSKNKTRAQVNAIEPPKPNKTLTLKGVNFVFNTTTLVSESKAKLEAAIKTLRPMNIKEIIVAGHTDNVGSAEYNQKLSEDRAKAIANILIYRLNLASSQIKSIGYGLHKPLVKNNSEENRLTNRRVELLIYTKSNP